MTRDTQNIVSFCTLLDFVPLQDNGVEKDLSQRVLDYYNYMWLRTKGVDTETLFDGLPLSLKADVSLSLYQDMINSVSD